MSWIEEYTCDLIEMQRGNYGQCPHCNRTLHREDIEDQIDAGTEFDAEACLKCKDEANKAAAEFYHHAGEPEETPCLEPRIKPSEY